MDKTLNLRAKALGLCPFALICKAILDKSHYISQSVSSCVKTREVIFFTFFTDWYEGLYRIMCVKLLSLWEVFHMGKAFMLLKIEGIEPWTNETTYPLPAPPPILLNHRSQVHSPLFRAILDSDILWLCVVHCVCVCVCVRERRKEKRQGDLSYHSGVLESMSERDLRIWLVRMQLLFDGVLF